VANQRHKNQVLVAFACDQKLLSAIEKARSGSSEDRSRFIRRAIVAELERLKIPIPTGLVAPPDRAGRKNKSIESKVPVLVNYSDEPPALDKVGVVESVLNMEAAFPKTPPHGQSIATGEQAGSAANPASPKSRRRTSGASSPSSENS